MRPSIFSVLSLMPSLASCQNQAQWNVSAPTVDQGDGKVATVDMSVRRGSPRYLASGFLNGIPENYPNQIPDKWYTGMKLQYGRSGGGEDPAPNRGWLYGFDEYRGRLELVLNEYKTLRNLGAKFILFSNDLWGADNDTAAFPGDDGSFDEFDKFWQQLLDDLVHYDALDGMEIDMWNEPDISAFWKRGTQQWVDTYNRYVKMTRADGRFNDVPLLGPTLASVPEGNNTWWSTWLSQIKDNETVPDVYTYHLLGTNRPHTRDPQYSNKTLSALIDQYGLPQRQVNVDEYASKTDQTPSGYAWWISRFERYDTYGLLGHYEHGATLHDLFANLLTKHNNATDFNATDYIAAAGWPVFNYYAECMCGERVGTSGSTDLEFDAYATYDEASKKVAILAGTRVVNGNYTLNIENLGSVGCPESGSLDITTTTYTGTADHRDPAMPPKQLGTQTLHYSDGTLSIPINQIDNHTAWTFEFCVPS